MVGNKGIQVHPTSMSFHDMLSKARQHAKDCIESSTKYNKDRWDKTHKEPTFVVGDKVLISTINFNNILGPKKMKDSFVGPFTILKLHGPNAAEVLLTGEFARKHPTFPVSLLKHYKESDKEKFPNREPMGEIVPFDEEAPKEIQKVLQQKMVKISNKDTRLYLVRYKGKGADCDEWLPESKIKNASQLLRKFRLEKKNSL
jgi:hypothetical protein